MRDSTYADLARLRTLITQEQFLNVARNQGYGRFIRRLDDGRWVCELAPKLEDLPDEESPCGARAIARRPYRFSSCLRARDRQPCSRCILVVVNSAARKRDCD